MNPNSFVHLHARSHYSLLEASCTPKALANKAAALEMPAVAMTDNGNMFGAIEFYFACQSAGVKPIIGMNAYLAPGARGEKGDGRANHTSLVLLAQNFKGYQNLCQLSSIGYKEGFYYKPRIDFEMLEKFSSDVILLSGGQFGSVPQAFLKDGDEKAYDLIKKFQVLFSDRFYLELCRPSTPQWSELEPFLVKASGDLNVPLVASNDVHYLEKDEQIAQEVLVCIGSNRTLSDDSRFRLGSDQFFFKPAQQMRDLFQDQPELCDRTLEIADRCNITFQLQDKDGKQIYHLPSFPTKGGVSLFEEMKRLTSEGLMDRFEEATARGEEVPEEKKPLYQERLHYELGVIDNMGFLGYFLIVQDFINWAKENNIPVGPGRGSGAGSLVAYTLKITDLDPVKYSLIFERFLNPERVSMPDFDIDFCQERRPEVIQYVTEKYGQGSVSQIITYGKLQARAAVRDVGRVLGMTYADVDVVSKLMPDKLGLTLKEALELEPRIPQLMESDPRVNTLMELAQKIEGLVRHAGIHAAGVVIADGELVDHAPLYRGTDGENVIQYDMKHAEKIGLIKFDFLGLKTLTHIQDTLNLIEKNRGKKITTQEIPLNDPEIYRLMSDGDSAGVFQFEGDGITDALKKIKPTCFEDIMAINALYRPGPMDMIPDYTKRKHGKQKVTYLFPELEEILKETYGIIIYQEQVQLIASRIASYSLGEADLLRRAMGKKIAEEMAKQQERFVTGAVGNNYDKKKAQDLFDLMAEFAKYGFNKSHSAAYCVIAAQTAWLKRYYPVEFFAALISTDMSDTDKVVKYVKLCKSRGLEVREPHVNYSDYKFSVKGDEIFYSLGAIKGVGQAAVEAIVEGRESLPDKKFEDLQQFFETVDLRRVNKKVIECLIKSGAFDGFGYHRAQLLAGYEQFLKDAEIKRRDQEVGQESLFAALDEISEEKIELPDVAPWNRMAKLSFEKDVLGFYLSDHPLNGFEAFSRGLVDSFIGDLHELPHKKKISVLGLIATKKELITKKGTRMAFLQVEDTSSSTEVIVFPDTFAKYETLLNGEEPLVITGVLENKEDTVKIIAEKVEPLINHFNKTKEVVFTLDESHGEELDTLFEHIKSAPGDTRFSLEMRLKDIERVVQLEVKEPRGIALTSDFFEKLRSHFGGTDFVHLR